MNATVTTYFVTGSEPIHWSSAEGATSAMKNSMSTGRPYALYVAGQDLFFVMLSMKGGTALTVMHFESQR